MKVINIYKIGLLLMVVLNAVLLFTRVQKPQRPGERGPGNGDLMEKISEELRLSPSQEADYFALAQSHRSTMRDIEEQEKEVLKSYFDLLKDDQVDTSSIAEKQYDINALEMKKLKATYTHFADLKSMCDEEQKARFPSIIDEIVNVLLNAEKKLPPPPRDH